MLTYLYPRRSLTVLLLVVTSVFWLSNDSFARRYPAGFDWKELRSLNVRVYYPAGYESYARMLALTSHEYLDSLYGWYGAQDQIARIVLNPEMDRSHAMALINPTRAELPLAPALDKGLRPQSSLYLDRVTGHELTHVYQIGFRHGITSYLSPVFGEAIAPVVLAPDWLIEGQAIWTESSKGGGRLYSSYQAMQMRTELAQRGSFWALDRISTAGRVHWPLNRAYTGGGFLYGSLAGEYLSSTHINLWMRQQSMWPGLTGWTFSRSYNGRTLGEQWHALEKAWQDRLRSRMRVLYEAGYAVGARLLDRTRTSYHHPKWTLEGELVVAERSYAHPNRLVSLSPAPAYHEEVIAETGGTSHDGLTPFLDGVIVSETRRGTFSPEQTTETLVLVTRDGRVSDLSDGGLNGWAPAFHSDEMKLAYVAPVDSGGMGLWTVPLDVTGRIAGDPLRLLHTKLGHISDPAWSRDGRKLAFTADLGAGEAVYVLDLLKDKLVRVKIEHALATWDPAFVNGDTLWVSADPTGIFNLYQVDFANESAVQRTRVVTGALEPAVSEDGLRVAYSHYTDDGFSLALLDSSRWLNEPAAVQVDTVELDVFQRPDDHLNVEVMGETVDYSPLPHMLPNYANPTLGFGDEYGLGISVHGRDPVGLLSWRLTGRYGFESEMPDFGASVTYRDLPVDLQLSAFSYPDELLEVKRIAPDSDTLYVADSWEREWDIGLTSYQTIHLDHGPWQTSMLPFAGLVQRFRHRQTSLDGGLELREYLGVRVGGTFVRSFGALRDPIPSRLNSVSVLAEQSFPGFGLEGGLLELSGRLHSPGPFTSTVFALEAAVQARSRESDLDFSRSGVRPRGYSDDDLPLTLRRHGRMLFAGGAFHFPLLFIDRGVPSLGTFFLERVTGSVFAEAATGWGGDTSISAWASDYGVASLGGTVGLHGNLLFQARTRLDLGVAWRSEYQDAAFFFTLSFPELYEFVNDAPGWEEAAR